jgi:transposase
MPSEASSTLLFAGIDVALDKLDLACCDQEENFFYEGVFPNTPAGRAKLRRHLAKLARQTKRERIRICLEPTSRYHLAIRQELADDQLFDVRTAQPYAARQFARATMERGKTDRVDARVLARYVLHCKLPPFTPPNPAAVELRAITRRISTLVTAKAQESNRLHAAIAGADPAAIVKSIKRHMADLAKQIAALEEAALELVKQDSVLHKQYTILLSVKGIGQRSGLQILGELALLPPDMGKRQWVAMAGLDPKPMESGKSVNPPRHISRQGNCEVRRAIYMPALVAIRYPGAGRDYYEHLLERGKKKMQAIVALMRKLICAVWGMFQTESLYDPARFYSKPA